MFYSEDDVQPAVNEAIKLFGPVGNMSMERNTMYNVSIATKEFGKLWYGDIDGARFNTTAIANALAALSKLMQQKVYILDDSFDFDKPLLTMPVGT